MASASPLPAPISITRRSDDAVVHVITFEHELNSGNQGETYIGKLGGDAVVIKKIPASITPLAKKRLKEQVLIEVALAEKFKACEGQKVPLTCFKGLATMPVRLDEKFRNINPSFCYNLPGPGYLLLYSFIEGGDLYEYITRAGPQILENNVSIIRQILQILVLLEEQGIAHRDIKLENLMLSNGQVKIIDFGVAIRKRVWEEGDTAGTPGFMSPELLLNTVTKETLFAADMFAAGMTIFELIMKCSYLYLVADFIGETYTDEGRAMFRYIPKRAYYDPRVVRYIGGIFPESYKPLWGLLCGMLHPTPESRPSAKEALAAFELLSFSEVKPVEADPFGTPRKGAAAISARLPPRTPRSEIIDPAEISPIDGALKVFLNTPVNANPAEFSPITGPAANFLGTPVAPANPGSTSNNNAVRAINFGGNAGGSRRTRSHPHPHKLKQKRGRYRSRKTRRRK